MSQLRPYDRLRHHGPRGRWVRVKGADVMSSDDSTGSGDNKILSGLPGPQAGSVSPLHGGPRPKAAEKNPFASSDQLEAQRPNEDDAPGDEASADGDQDAPVDPVATESTSAPPIEEAAPLKAAQAPTSAFHDEPASQQNSNMGLMIVVIVAVAAVAYFALR